MYICVVRNYGVIDFREAREVLNVLQNHRGDARDKAQQIITKIPSGLAQELNATSARSNFGASSNIRETDIAVISTDRYLVSSVYLSKIALTISAIFAHFSSHPR